MNKIMIIVGGMFFLLFNNSCEPIEGLMPETQTNFVSASEEELINSFAVLTEGRTTACSFIYSPEEIPRTLCGILEDAEQGSEIVFLVDKTSSMRDDIDQVKENINLIIDCLPKSEMRLGAATYGDYFADGVGWYDFVDLTSDYDVIRDYINGISVVGGGDYPESVYDGIWETLENMSWKDCSAPDKIIVMGDAPPLEGSGTLHSVDEVLDKSKSICPNTEFYPLIIFDL